MGQVVEVGACTIVHGDNVETLRLMPENSVHSCVTDPPYGIGFMGKEWDTFAPATVKTAAETKQRKDPLLLLANQNLKGRTRSPAISPSGIDYDRTLTGQRGFQSWCEAWACEVYRVLMPGAHMLVCGAPRSYHRMTAGVEDAGFEIRDCIMWVFGQGFPKSKNLTDDWKGWGTALKPAWEPILIARKPLAKSMTVQQSMEAYGTGAINIEACRVGTNKRVPGSISRGTHGTALAGSADNSLRNEDGTGSGHNPDIGRWPADLIHDGSEEVLAAFPEAAGQLADAKIDPEGRKTVGIYGTMKRGREASASSSNEGTVGFKMKPGARRLDTGSAARFFYCAKTSRKDRDDGCEALPLTVADTQHKRPRSELDDPRPAGVTPRTNSHPTVKPTALMQYLVRLVTPPGGIVLDPFNGSGSTGKACVYEGFSYIGMEKEESYVDISAARINFALRNLPAGSVV